MYSDQIISIVALIFVGVWIAFLFYSKQYDKLKKIAYRLIIEVEFLFKDKNANGKTKFNIVLNSLYDKHIPKWLKFLFPQNIVEQIVQDKFDEIKEELHKGLLFNEIKDGYGERIERGS